MPYENPVYHTRGGPWALDPSVILTPEIDGRRTCKTTLYDTHVKYGGKMVPFAGFLLE